MKRGIIFFVLVVLFIGIASASLGITPAKKEINFIPNGEHEFVYQVLTENPDSIIEVYLDGDFAEYATLSNNEVRGYESFKVKIKFPNNVDIPGRHSILVRVREKPGEDEFIGTMVDIGALIKIFVPYPGKYIDASLNIPDGNVDEKIPIELITINRGVEPLNVNVNIDFFSGDEKIYSMPFTSVLIESTQDRYFRKFLDTTGYSPGNYVAKAIVDYGEIKEVNQSFRVGHLFVDVVNHTERLKKGEIKKYEIGVESNWNGVLEEVFADVNVSNGLEDIVFRTPTVQLEAWDSSTLIGFIDTSEMEGVYDVEIVLNYGEIKTTEFGKLEIYSINYLMISIIIGVLVIIILLVIFRKKFFKRFK